MVLALLNSYLAGEIMGLDFVREKIFKDARDHPEQADLKGFEFAAVIAVLNYYLRWEDSGELHLIAAIGIEGEFAYSQEELAFSLNDMANLRYGVGEAPVLGHPAVWVATTDESPRQLQYLGGRKMISLLPSAQDISRRRNSRQ